MYFTSHNPNIKVSKKKSSASCQVHFIYLFLKNNLVFHVPKIYEILK